VGYRWFVEKAARELTLRGYARNLADGRVEVYVIGAPEQLAELEARLAVGPRMAEVRSVEGAEAAFEERNGFHTY